MIHEIADSLGIKRRDTQKLFYGKFSHSVRVVYPVDYFADYQNECCAAYEEMVESTITNGKVYSAYRARCAKARRAYRSMVRDFVAEVMDDNPSVFEHFHESTSVTKSVTFYFVEDDPLSLLMRGPHSHLIDQYSLPKTADAANKLAAFQDRSVVVRDTLFWGQYAYKVDFTRRHDFATLDERMQKLFFTKPSDYRFGMNRCLYLVGKSDLFLVKIGLAEDIEKITECILIEEEK